MLRAVSSIPLYLGSFTYATLPAAASYSGMTALASDVGVGPGMMLISDGTRWRPLGPQVLAKSGAAVSCGADVTEDTLATITVPANLMGLNGMLRITPFFSCTNGANNKIPRVKFGGTVYFGPTVTTIATDHANIEIINRNATNSQVGNAIGFGTSSATPTTSAIDTTAAVTVLITGQKASAGDSLTLESYLVEILP